MNIIRRLTVRPPLLFRLLFPGALFRLPGKKKRVCLTFDDGPIPEVTPEVLGILDRFGVKGTFFMVGDNVRKYPEVAEMVRKSGHSVGSHTFHHLQGMRSGVEEYLEDVRQGVKMTGGNLFRPPHGLLKRRQLKGLRSLGLMTVMFDVVAMDYDSALTGGEVAAIVKQMARPGSIIVFHDSLKSIDRLRHALPEVITALRDDGYEFVTLGNNER